MRCATPLTGTITTASHSRLAACALAYCGLPSLSFLHMSNSTPLSSMPVVVGGTTCGAGEAALLSPFPAGAGPLRKKRWLSSRSPQTCTRNALRSLLSLPRCTFFPLLSASPSSIFVALSPFGFRASSPRTRSLSTLSSSPPLFFAPPPPFGCPFAPCAPPADAIGAAWKEGICGVAAGSGCGGRAGCTTGICGCCVIGGAGTAGSATSN
mmetsp:Transcript_11147/g.26278  ORF Transcript_11147/g.26278 Transcript_11147/m.26278 type:complete len:210 (+) Transcript_11147:504-1133(+)